MNYKQKLFLGWFFSGSFFNSLKQKLQIERGRQENDFAITFFNNDQELIDLFNSNPFPKLTKGNIGLCQIEYINKRELSYVKNIILDPISFADDPLLSIRTRLRGHNRICNNYDTVTKFMIDQYGKFRDSRRCISYVKSLNGQVCAYCDKGIIDCTDKHFYGDLDHVHDKSTYYYYALNIYNLSPCCKVCNQKKGKNALKFNPLELKLDDVFNFYIDDSDMIRLLTNMDSSNDISVKLKQKNDDLIPILEDLNKRLALDDRYKNSGLIVGHLSQLKRIYTKEYIDEISTLLNDNYNANEIKSFLLSDYSKGSFEKIQPLTKLIRDIANELDLFPEDGI
ncbi:hypothetical protein [Enterobacter mori]|uniref:hypothetical protein n=1 Tax=Enterobacter mori TaxID=539813 RepID=UPI002DBAE2B7|nr:hypothetical protein [Enterobacter mori]MEB7918576.1 hypothetical protein [Enterobacter mori]